MPKHKDIIQMIKDTGFNIEAKIDMVRCQYEYQYIYIFKKI